LLCEICLGENPNIRMIKLPYGHKSCKMSGLPYQGFRWKAGPHGRFKETVVSYSVAKEKNICQACLNDLRYNLPVGVRNSIVNQQEASQKRRNDSSFSLPQGVSLSASSSHQLLINPFSVSEKDGSEEAQHFQFERTNAVASKQLDALSSSINSSANRRNQSCSSFSSTSSSVAFRNLPKLCSFWLNGLCRRVETKRCPFRPCCGVYLFPEIAGKNRELHQKLIDLLNKEGPMKVQTSLDKETRNAIQQSLKGNKEEAIKKRVAGDDELTKKYLGKADSMVSQSYVFSFSKQTFS
jgi:hypothetical protein